MQHVFISFKHEDLDFAENVISRLEKAGFTTWADHKIGVGDEWRTSIDLAIKNAFALIVTMTPEAKASEYVTYEWAFAWGVGIRVIPIMLRATQLHPRLEALQYLDFTNPKSRPWDRLIEEVKTASHAPLTYSINIPLNSPPFIRQAVAALDSAVPNDRASGIETLKQAAKTPAAYMVLREALKHPLSDVRYKAVFALAEIKDPASVPVLIEMLKAPDSHVRYKATDALAALKDPASVPALVEMLKDPDYSVRQLAAYVLRALKDPASVPALIEMLKDPNNDVRIRAVETLAEIKDPASVPALVEMLKEPDNNGARWRAAQAIGEIKDPASVPALVEALQDPDDHVRRAAAYALIEIKDPTSVVEALKAPDNDMRRAAVETLAALKDPASVPTLIEMLKDPNNDMRRAAVQALAALKDPASVPALVEALQDDTVSGAARRLLRVMGWNGSETKN